MDRDALAREFADAVFFEDETGKYPTLMISDAHKFADIAMRHIEAARAEERERYRDWQTETRALVLLEAVNAMRARETAELVMRDLARLNGDNDTAQLHSDRAQAFREAYGAFPNLESLQIRAGSPAPAAPVVWTDAQVEAAALASFNHATAPHERPWDERLRNCYLGQARAALEAASKAE